MYGWNSKILLLVAPLCAAPLGAAAQSDFYKGKSLNVYIGFAPGGSYDFYGRLVARHIGKHLQGSPVVIPNSMPGAGSLRTANYLYTVAPKDGTAIGIVTQTLPLEVALGNTAAKYNANEFAWIGRATDVSDVAIAWHTAKAKTWADLRSMDTTMANTGPGSTTYGFPKLLNALGATKFVLVRGYPGSTQAMLAMEQGETDSASTSWNTLRTAKASWFRDKQVNVLVMYTRSRIRDLPDVPAAPELGVDENAKKILAFYASSADIGRSFIAPPGLTAERISELRDAFSKTMNDPEYLAEINKTRADHEPLSGAEMQRIVAEIADFPQELVNRMQEILNAPK